MAIRTDEEARDILQGILQPGQEVFTVVTKWARGSASRHLKVFVADTDKYTGRPTVRDITRLVGRVTGIKVNPDTDALIVHGVGMDMGFHVVYSLGRALYGDSVTCTGSNGWREVPSSANGWEGKHDTKRYACRSNDHMNDRTMPYSRRIKHRDSGYAFRHVWL